MEPEKAVKREALLSPGKSRSVPGFFPSLLVFLAVTLAGLFLAPRPAQALPCTAETRVWGSGAPAASCSSCRSASIRHHVWLLRLEVRQTASGIRVFLWPDPIGFAGGENLYSYGADNPLRFLDPTGKDLYIVFRNGKVPPQDSAQKPGTIDAIVKQAMAQNAREGNDRANENLGHGFVIVRNSPAIKFVALDYYPGANKGGTGSPDVNVTNKTFDLQLTYANKLQGGPDNLRAIRIHTTPAQDLAILKALREFRQSDPQFGLSLSGLSPCTDPLLMALKAAGIKIPALGQTQVYGQPLDLNRIPRLLAEGLIKEGVAKEVSIDEALDSVMTNKPVQ